MTTFVLKKDDKILIESVEGAFGLAARMRGLLGRNNLEMDHALYIKPCGSIHTFGMRFSLDLIFLDKNLSVVKIVHDVSPGKMVLGGKYAASVIELESGWFDWQKLNAGDSVALVVSANRR
jgi:uncharacterized membrane protein (UPF0127 family)